LIGKLNFSKPLEMTGHQIGNHLSAVLQKIEIKSENFEDLKKIIVEE
jgi:hypothetical protein